MAIRVGGDGCPCGTPHKARQPKPDVTVTVGVEVRDADEIRREARAEVAEGIISRVRESLVKSLDAEARNFATLDGYGQRVAVADIRRSVDVLKEQDLKGYSLTLDVDLLDELIGAAANAADVLERIAYAPSNLTVARRLKAAIDAVQPGIR